MPIVGQFGSLARAGSFLLPGGAMESIATITVGSGGASSIEFASLPSGFQHLQIRMMTAAVSDTQILARFNSDTASNYAIHVLFGDGATASAAAAASSSAATIGNVGNTQPAALIADILDYASTSKAKTVRSMYGIDKNGSGAVGLRSALWTSTNAITTIRLLLNDSSNFPQHTIAALYGLRAP